MHIPKCEKIHTHIHTHTLFLTSGHGYAVGLALGALALAVGSSDLEDVAFPGLQALYDSRSGAAPIRLALHTEGLHGWGVGHYVLWGGGGRISDSH